VVSRMELSMDGDKFDDVFRRNERQNDFRGQPV